MILFTDLDGTLFNDNKEFTSGNRDAINRALDQGHQVVISTGRPLVSAKLQAETLQLDREGCYVIAFNGGEIYDFSAGKSIYKKTIPLDQVKYVFQEAESFGLHCQTYDDKQILCTRASDEVKRYHASTKVPFRVVPDVIEALPSPPCKMIVISFTDHEKLLRFRDSTAPWASGKLDRFFSNDWYLEHVPVGVSKGTAVRYLCEYLHADLADTIAVGDAENDIPMIRTAGLGVAMKNADAAVKEAADWITTRDNNQDGVAEIIERYLLKPSLGQPF